LALLLFIGVEFRNVGVIKRSLGGGALSRFRRVSWLVGDVLKFKRVSKLVGLVF